MKWTDREIYVRTMMNFAEDFPDGAYFGFLMHEKGIDVEEIVAVSKKIAKEREDATDAEHV